MHLYAFIAILGPKLVAMSKINSPIAQTLSQNETLHRCVAYNSSYGHFCDVLAYFGQNLVATATSLRPLQSDYIVVVLSRIWIGRPLKLYLEPKILSVAVTQAKLCRFEGSRQFSIMGIGNFR